MPQITCLCYTRERFAISVAAGLFTELPFSSLIYLFQILCQITQLTRSIFDVTVSPFETCELAQGYHLDLILVCELLPNPFAGSDGLRPHE